MATKRLGPATATTTAAVGGVAAALMLALVGCGSAQRLSASPASSSGATSAAAGIPPALAAQARPIGRGPRFHPPARGAVPEPCRPSLGRRIGTHVEVFAANRVVLVAAGIGVRGPVRRVEGRIVGARCFSPFVTVEPTGVVLVAPGARPTVADLLHAWGVSLSADRLAGFSGRVSAYVGGRRVRGPVGQIVLTPHAEVVLEVGPFVPPHAAYRFPPGA